MGRKPVQEGAYHIAMRKIEGDLLTWYIHEADGNMTRAADMLGLQTRHLYRRLKAVGIDPDAIRGPALQGLPADVPAAVVDAAAGATMLDAINNGDPLADEIPDDPTSDFDPVDDDDDDVDPPAEETESGDAQVIPIHD